MGIVEKSWSNAPSSEKGMGPSAYVEEMALAWSTESSPMESSGRRGPGSRDQWCTGVLVESGEALF